MLWRFRSLHTKLFQAAISNRKQDDYEKRASLREALSMTVRRQIVSAAQVARYPVTVCQPVPGLTDRAPLEITEVPLII